MKPFKIERILIPTDFSETGLLAVEHASFMARLFKADLFLLHVIEISEYSYSVYDPAIKILDLGEIRQVVEEKLEEQAKKIRNEYHVNVNTLCADGRISSEVANAVKENNISLIVMGTHGASGSEEFFLGSNAHRTVTSSPCPVISVQSHATKLGFKDIVLPIDNTLHSRQKVDYAIEIAKHYASKIHILGLLETNEKIDVAKFDIKLKTVEKAINKAKLTFSLETMKADNLAVETMEYSQKVKGDLIIMMTDHESNITGMFLGARAKQIVNHSGIPVMSIRPVEGEFDSIDLSAASPF